jgi:hypothetical protein
MRKLRSVGIELQVEDHLLCDDPGCLVLYRSKNAAIPGDRCEIADVGIRSGNRIAKIVVPTFKAFDGGLAGLTTNRRSSFFFHF